VVGTWKWYLGLSETVYFSDGSIRHSSGVMGRGNCSGSDITASYTNGVTERDKLSPDGDSLFVNSSWNGGVSFIATREGKN
jgi:hypothetical protein